VASLRLPLPVRRESRFTFRIEFQNSSIRIQSSYRLPLSAPPSIMSVQSKNAPRIAAPMRSDVERGESWKKLECSAGAEPGPVYIDDRSWWRWSGVSAVGPQSIFILKFILTRTASRLV
jgi:hypothetical protein